MNIIVKDMRQDKEQMKMKFEDELSALKNDLEYVKKKSDEFSFALKQAEAEKVSDLYLFHFSKMLSTL